MIEVSELTKRYGEHTAVDDLSFVVHPGVVTGFLGPNGAGKSTTMRMILGLDRPTAGRATVNGRPFADHRAPVHEMGALLEAKGVHPGRPARDHLRALAATVGISNRRVDEVLELVGLSDVAGDRSGGFSLGMGQRLGIASALLGDPHTVMLDEPVNGLDPEGILWIRNLLKSLAAEGRTVFVSSHLMSEMTSALSVRVRSPQALELIDVLSADGVEIVIREPELLEVTGLSADEIGAGAWAADLRLQELTPMRASLEETFMDLTRDAVEYQGVSGINHDTNTDDDDSTHEQYELEMAS